MIQNKTFSDEDLIRFFWHNLTQSERKSFFEYFLEIAYFEIYETQLAFDQLMEQTAMYFMLIEDLFTYLSKYLWVEAWEAFAYLKEWTPVLWNQWKNFFKDNQ